MYVDHPIAHGENCALDSHAQPRANAVRVAHAPCKAAVAHTAVRSDVPTERSSGDGALHPQLDLAMPGERGDLLRHPSRCCDPSLRRQDVVLAGGFECRGVDH